MKTILGLATGLLLAAGGGSGWAQGRLAGIQAVRPADRPGAVRRLVDSLKTVGGPLVEATDDSTARVTFLWVGDAATRSAVVITPATLYDFRGSVMQRLEGTDVWSLSVVLPRTARLAYRFEVDGPLTAFDQDPQFFRRIPTWRRDPLNPRTFVYVTGDTASVLALDRAPDASWSRPRADVPHGTVVQATLTSAVLGGDRAIWLYTPPATTNAEAPYPFLVLTDGDTYFQRLGVAATLDNLIQAGKIRPLVVVGVTSSDRSRDLACSDVFGSFLAEELLPWARSHAHVTRDPRDVAVGGYSLGGLAAACAALRHPDLIGAVLSQSGSFRRSGLAVDDAPEGVARFVAGTGRREVRFYLEVGTEEIGPLFGGDPSALTATRHLRDVLRARGYPLIYRERASGHEPVAWRGTLPLALEALFHP